MVTVLVTSFLLFAAISYAIYWWQRSSSNENAERILPPSRMHGLFGELNPADEAALLAAEKEANRLALRSSLLARAAEGDKKTLDEAQATTDAGLYDEVLDALTPEMLERYERYVRPGAALTDETALARIGERWELAPASGSAYPGPTLILASRPDHPSERGHRETRAGGGVFRPSGRGAAAATCLRRDLSR